MPGGTHLDPYYLWGAPTDISPTRANLALVMLIMIARHTSAVTIMELRKIQGLLLTNPGGYVAYPGPQKEVMRRDRERERT